MVCFDRNRTRNIDQPACLVYAKHVVKLCVLFVNSDLECNLQTIGRYEGICVFQKSDIVYVC